MKIIITENKIDRLKGLIEKQGVKSAIQLMGGLDNLAKVLGYDTVPGYIYQYLSEMYYPDYNWEHKDYYRDEVNRFGSFAFVVNDRNAYDYFTYDETESSKLDIAGWLYNELEELFDGYDWKSIFKKWFETNTGLKVGWVE